MPFAQFVRQGAGCGKARAVAVLTSRGLALAHWLCAELGGHLDPLPLHAERKHMLADVVVIEVAAVAAVVDVVLVEQLAVRVRLGDLVEAPASTGRRVSGRVMARRRVHTRS